MTAARDSPQGQDESLRRMEDAKGYNAWLIGRGRPHLGRRVLDVGAGVGTFTEMLASWVDEVVAVEPDPALSALLKRRVGPLRNVTVVELTAGELRREALPGPFDSVVCFNVLEHIPDDGQALARFREQLAPGGRLLLLVPAHPLLFGSIDRTVGHVRRYRRSQLRRLLEGAGFELEQLRYVNPVGALGWLVSARIVRSEHVPEGPLRLYDRLVPLLRALDLLRLPFGLSLWAVARSTSL